MDAQPKIGGFGCFKGVLQIPFFLLMQFHKAIFYFNPKMGHMLNLAIVDKLNRAGFVVAPYNTPEEVPSVKSVSGPARHVGEADKRVRDSRGGSPCGENRCGIGECREGEGTRGAPQERAKLTRTIFYILRSEVSSIEKYDAPRRIPKTLLNPNFGRKSCGQAERTPYSSCFPHLHQTEGVRLGQGGSNIATCRGTRDLIVRRRGGRRGGGGQRGEKNRPQAKPEPGPYPPVSSRALCGPRRSPESE